MTTLDELIYDQSQPQDSSGDLEKVFMETFDLEGWQFAMFGSIPYGTLPSDIGPTLSITAIPNGPGFEWQLNGVSFLQSADAELPLEERRMRLVAAASRAGYIRATTQEQPRSKP